MSFSDSRLLTTGYIPHDPGTSPHRPHIGAASFPEDLAPPSPPTANRLSTFVVFGEPHSGHFGVVSSDIDRTS